jgi:hypothetical protein
VQGQAAVLVVMVLIIVKVMVFELPNGRLE